ncbi:MAG: hypothetical protein IPJ45_08680 [Ignavibacteria bacterium]|nr:hypothetical protein [Ignavibacteria bacterium]
MKLTITILLIAMLNFLQTNSFADTNVSAGDDPRVTEIIPNSYAGVTGTGTFLGPLSNAQRTYQFLIQSSQLTNVAGKVLTGLSMRIPASATANWPLADANFTNYDIYLSGSVEPSARSLTFANNIVGARTQVRSGSLTILANSYTFGGSPNAFGTEIAFNIPWYYAGGNLLIEIRHSGFTGTSRSTDALLTSTAGYGTLVSGCWTGSYTGTSGTQGNFTVVKLSAAEPYSLNLKALIEGRYNNVTDYMKKDTAKVYLRNSSSPYAIIDSAVSVLDTNGSGIFNYANASNGVNYFIVVKHRNSINVWSNTGYSFSGNSLSFDFTTAAGQAYGGNLIQKGSRYTIYSGDINQDDVIDASDGSDVDNDASLSVSGYVKTDVTGDDFVDAEDVSIVDNNAYNLVSLVRP